MTQRTTSPEQRQVAQLEAAKAFQARHLKYLRAGDLDGLVANCYTHDARIHTFRFRQSGPQQLKELIALVAERLQRFDSRNVTFFAAGDDYIWQELRLERAGEQVGIYEYKFLREGKVYLQLMGEKSGSLWLPEDYADSVSSDGQTQYEDAAQVLHHRYIDYQARGDADGMADDFFTEDARLVTAKMQIEGRENLRTFFRDKFVKDTDFRLVSMRHITGDEDYVWFEATAASSLGARTVYDVMLLREGKVHTQLVGTLEGNLPANKQ